MIVIQHPHELVAWGSQNVERKALKGLGLIVQPERKSEDEPPSSMLGEPAVGATPVTGRGRGNVADRAHSTLPSVATTKWCVPKHTEVPGSQEMVVKAIRRVLMESNVDALDPFLARQLSVFRIPTSTVRV